jgi:signal transduction histidine kinase
MTLKVLHVEDNPVDADLARRHLARQDSDIALEHVPSLGGARTKLDDAGRYDLVLIDLKLPDGNGLELLAEIRERGLPLAVVVLTGSGDENAAIAALKAGADDYLIKRHEGFEKLSTVLRDAAARFRAAKVRRARPLRVLYAEHAAADIDLTRRHLARYAPHMRLRAVNSALEALNLLPVGPDHAADFDVVLFDYRLPGLDALEATKVLRQDRGLDIPIVLVTGQGNEEVASQALHLGVDSFITKHEGYLHELAPTLEKVQSQRELERYQRQLEGLVATRTAELKVALERAEYLARVKSSFLANMSHEIRTPLNGVLGLAQIGFRDSAGQERLRSHFSRILDSGKLLNHIINDILDFSKIEAGKLKIDQIPTDLHDVIRQLVDMFQGQVSAKSLKLLVRGSTDVPPSIISDPLRLEQILLNLLSNAIKFTERGHIKLTLGRRGDTLEFQVEDTGIGMDEAQLARIFDPFEQARADTSRKFGGTGLGLTITHRLVELMGGEMAVASTPGQGSTFTVRLPLVAAPEQAEQTATSAPPAGALRLAGLTILAAEDNEINQIVLADMLETEGARVVMAANGREAVERFTQDGRAAYNLALLDISMPEMDGHEAARQILALSPDMPIIGQTAYAMAEEKAACLASGMVDHIAKPFELEDLVRVVLKHLR